MSDYESIMTDADADRAYDKDQDRHNREGHTVGEHSSTCLVCEQQLEECDKL